MRGGVKAGFAVGQPWAKMLPWCGLPGAQPPPVMGDKSVRGNYTRESTSVVSGMGKVLSNVSSEAGRKEQKLLIISSWPVSVTTGVSQPGGQELSATLLAL